ncbi:MULTISPECIES: hypothetical protein [unclassified Streptomyces]|uniref:hypothetical protein n=1 Tax=unclassified Streptomyces TaxID=2593676 RepID=UPI002E170E0B|nr:MULTISPECIES: hypothetical protein [unclassified Streptomyces]
MTNWAPSPPLRRLMITYAVMMITLLFAAFALGQWKMAATCLVGAGPGIAACIYFVRRR